MNIALIIILNEVEDGIVGQSKLALQRLHLILLHAGELTGLEVVQIHEGKDKTLFINPRRPALPAIWKYSRLEMDRKVTPSHFVLESKHTVLQEN